MNFKPHHIAFTVNNIDESLDWYQSKLGFSLIHKYEKHGMEIALLKLNDTRIELFSYGVNTKPLPDYRKHLMDDLHIVGTKHLCIEVQSLEETIKDLKERRVEFVTEIDTASFGGRYVFFKDCNGILLELYQA